MQRYIASLIILLLVGTVVSRVLLMRRSGMSAMHFGKIDTRDFLIPPFALFYFYTVFAAAFDWPSFTKQELFHSEAVSWVGVLLCVAGLVLVLMSLVAFGSSFRVGIDTSHPDKLVTTGVFSLCRNPIYVAFWIVLSGQFLVFPNLLLFVYLGAASWLFHRQVLREEAYLKEHYGSEYSDYCARVRRYV
jgi:protein-S-isoprenylcysteine O-methyltransferase Ste14